MEHEIDPAELEPDIDARQQEDHDEERDGQVDGRGATKELESARPWGAPPQDEPRERDDADEIALDREVGEEPGRIEGTVVRQLDRLGDDRRHHEHHRDGPDDGQDLAPLHEPNATRR